MNENDKDNEWQGIREYKQTRDAFEEVSFGLEPFIVKTYRIYLVK